VSARGVPQEPVWSAEEVALVRATLDAPLKSVVAQFSGARTYNAISKMRTQLRDVRAVRSPMVWTPEMIARVRMLWKREWSVRRIAREFGVPAHKIRGVVHRHNFPRRTKGFKPPRPDSRRVLAYLKASDRPRTFSDIFLHIGGDRMRAISVVYALKRRGAIVRVGGSDRRQLYAHAEKAQAQPLRKAETP
jgi:hypothetical protein